MDRRLKLQAILENDILKSDMVYFQPPESIRLSYPCIIYDKSNARHIHADDKTYLYVQSYEVTIIDPDPDSKIGDRILETFPMSRFDRFFVSDNLNHFVYNIYY